MEKEWTCANFPSSLLKINMNKLGRLEIEEL